VITVPIGGSSAWLARIDSGVSRLISAEQRDQSSPDGGCWEYCPGRSAAVPGFHITTQAINRDRELADRLGLEGTQFFVVKGSGGVQRGG